MKQSIQWCFFSVINFWQLLWHGWLPFSDGDGFQNTAMNSTQFMGCYVNGCISINDMYIVYLFVFCVGEQCGLVLQRRQCSRWIRLGQWSGRPVSSTWWRGFSGWVSPLVLMYSISAFPRVESCVTQGVHTHKLWVSLRKLTLKTVKNLIGI